ncbi:MAG TPA: RsmD family RNA methyltransferase, partial [Nevskia sp.]|nr:RsmD family RNA methyltransferase [Nevskia sp.]
GALGFEALSRGAAHASFVEQGASQAAAIREAAAQLAAGDRAEIAQADALAWLRGSGRRYDLVFLDPPYGAGLLEPALAALPRVLAPTHRIYLEWPAGKPPLLPPGYSLLKEKSAGQVSYGLATYNAGTASDR